MCLVETLNSSNNFDSYLKFFILAMIEVGKLEAL